MVIDGTIEILDDVVLCFNWCEEIARNDFGALMDQLVEGVLPILCCGRIAKSVL